ncbi:hypothetical protein J2X65_003484 [Ancylobacter sp. 3268]|nr:hypothetical protein [Ancylobacter sp. 3268]
MATSHGGVSIEYIEGLMFHDLASLWEASVQFAR